MGSKDDGFKGELKAQVAASLKAGDKARTTTLRMMLSVVTNKEIELRRALDEGESVQVVQTMIRQRRDSIEQYEKGGRSELADIEKAEIKILEEFLPVQLTVAEVEAIVSETARELEAASMKDMGRLMKAVMIKVKGRTGGKVVQEAVKKALSA
ncbi:MAG: GatB/YqeY domain-containing protein [Thermodesulfobacteriota bacterium]